MSSGIVRCAISTVLEKKAMMLDSTRVKDYKKVGQDILEKIVLGEAEVTAFDTFSTTLLCVFKSPFDHTRTYRSPGTKRQKLWSEFHQLRVKRLPKIWEQLFKALDLQVDDPFLQQSANQEVFEILLMEHFTQQSSSHGEQDAAESPPLSKDELNAMRYAGGYVPHSLLKRFEKRKGKKYDQFIECLGDMAVESEHSDFLNYTKDWIGKVNRGGLFPLNDMTYCFFVAIEKVIRVLLPRYVVKPSESHSQFKDEIIDTIVKNEDIQWHWTLISQCIDSEEDAVELLEEIVSLWVTIRGFSLAATWMEVYKRETKKTTKKSRGLRKELSRSAN